MVWRIPFGPACCCWLMAASTLFGQVYNTADYVRNTFHKYLNREPSSEEMTQWVWSLQKGLDPAEAQATFLASDEYFNRYARNASAWITGLFTDVLDRPPTTDESIQWLHSYNVSGSNRSKLVRDFLKAAKALIPTAPAIAEKESVSKESQLVATSKLLDQSVEKELGGTQPGRELSVKSRNLVNASRSLEKSKAVSPAAYKQALLDVQSALTAVDRQLSQVYFSAQDCVTYLNQYKQIADSLLGVQSTMAPLPKPATSTANVVTIRVIDAKTYNDAIQLSRALLSDTNQVLLLLRGSSTLTAAESQLLRDTEFFHSQISVFQQRIHVGMSEQDMRHEILRLRALAQGITQGMSRTGQVGRVVQRWEIAMGDLQQLGALVGISTGAAIDPGQPVLISLPTYNQLPYQVQRPTTAQLASQTIPLTDQAIAQVDAFVTGFNLFLPMSPRVPALQSQARALGVLLGQFRQELTSGANTPQLKARLAQINQARNSLQGLWTFTIQERHLTNTPDLNGITASINRLNEIFKAA